MTPALEVGALVADGRLATVHRGSLAGRAVAVKRARTGVPGAASALRREVRILLAAAHPALVPVVDVVDDPMAPAVVLGWADGGSLSDLLADGPLPAVDLLHVLRPVAGALEALHRAGVAHLDVTPGNVLLAAAGPVLIDPAPPGAGTPGFADPVVVGGGPASWRSDVFGLAACAHVALTGRPPSRRGVAAGTALPPAVAAVLAAGLAADPGRRPASPSALVDRLERALRGRRAMPGVLVGQEPRAGGRPVPRQSGVGVGPPRTWPFDRWREEAGAAAERQVAVQALLQPAAPPSPRRPHRGFRRKTSASDSTPRRQAVPLPPNRPLEATHDTTAPDRALACCPWPRTRAGG